MTIVRAPRPEQNYTIIRNELINDVLSCEALGVITYLLSKPDNWKISKRELGKHFKVGRDKINRIINELIGLGYMEKQQPRDSEGKLLETVFMCRDVGVNSAPVYVKSAPQTEKPSTDKPSTENPHLLNTERLLIPELDKGEPSEASELQQAFEAYNATAKDCGLPLAQHLTDTRTKSLKKRLGECGGLDGWDGALAKVRGSPFLTGDNDRGWKADFDFVLQQKSFTRLMEGFYDGSNQRQPAQNTRTKQQQRTAATNSAIERQLQIIADAERRERAEPAASFGD